MLIEYIQRKNARKSPDPFPFVGGVSLVNKSSMCITIEGGTFKGGDNAVH